MAATGQTLEKANNIANLKTSPDSYVALGELLEYNKPDNMDLYVKTYGDQGITGFLELTGAKKNAGTSDQIQYWEEGRLHKTFTATLASAIAGPTLATGTITFAQGDGPRPNDVLLTQDGGETLLVTAATPSATYEVATVRSMGGATIAAGNSKRFSVIGNIAAQGSSQPDDFYQTEITKRTQDFIIARETFHVNGSQATNIGWINTGNGDYRWYIKGENDTRKRFMDQREMLMLFGQRQYTNSAAADSDNNGIVGTEGYFSALSDRGILTTALATGTLSDLDDVILELDKQGAPSEYAMYLNREASLKIDDALAVGAGANLTAGLASQFGAFNNSQEMAVNLGFKSFTRGGYTFHKHDWKLLNDPTLAGSAAGVSGGGHFRGAMIPMTQVADARTGERAPSLQMYFKDAGGYSREMNHWVEGGDVLGFKTNNEDVAKFHYRSECCLVTRAANQHVLLTAS
jgi:hypothetical protein